MLQSNGSKEWPNLEELRQAVRTPEPDPHFFVDLEVKTVVDTVIRRTEGGEVVNLLVTGGPGVGKTALARQIAAWNHRPFFALDCGAVRQVTDWWGTRELEGGRTVLYPSAFVFALSIENAVVLLDEINRTAPQNANALLPILDWRRSTYIPAIGLSVRVGTGTLIVATGNLGENGLSGTFPMDSSLRDRLVCALDLRPPPSEAIREILVARTRCGRTAAERLVTLMVEINEVLGRRAVGMRHLIETGHLVREGLSLASAAKLTIYNPLLDEGETVAAQVGAVLTGVLGWQRR